MAHCWIFGYSSQMVFDKISSDVSGEIICRNTLGWLPFIFKSPTDLTIYGFTMNPPLAIVLYAIAICNVEDAISCPIDTIRPEIPDHCFNVRSLPGVSPGKRMPEVMPNPNLREVL